MNKLEHNINVLIPDGHRAHVLDVIRCLSMNKKIKIHVLSSRKWVKSRFSRYISSFTLISPNLTEQETIEVLRQNILTKEIDVLLPVFVNKIRFLSKHRGLFQDLTNLILPSVESFDIANDKLELARFLEKKNINKPITYDLVELDQIKGDINFPIILKPVYGEGGEGVRKVNNAIELIAKRKEINPNEKYMVQDYIKGYDLGMSVLCQEGKILAYTIQKGLINKVDSYEAPIGVEFLFEEEVYNSVEKMMAALNWSGVANVDFRYDEVENNFKIIEINPRYWGSLEGSEKVGVNFPYLNCLTSLGIDYKKPDFQYEGFAKKSGILKIMKSKISLEKVSYKFPKYSTIKADILDPLPKISMAILSILRLD